MSKTLIHHIGTQEEYDNGDTDSKIIRRRVVCIHFDGYFSPQWHSPPNLLKKVYVYATLGAVFRGDALELYLARPVPQRLTRRSPSSDTPPLHDATLIPYDGGRRIPSEMPGAGEYRIELDGVR